MKFTPILFAKYDHLEKAVAIAFLAELATVESKSSAEPSVQTPNSVNPSSVETNSQIVSLSKSIYLLTVSIFKQAKSLVFI
jgi:hypothetical protein